MTYTIYQSHLSTSSSSLLLLIIQQYQSVSSLILIIDYISVIGYSSVIFPPLIFIITRSEYFRIYFIIYFYAVTLYLLKQTFATIITHDTLSDTYHHMFMTPFIHTCYILKKNREMFFTELLYYIYILYTHYCIQIVKLYYDNHIF